MYRKKERRYKKCFFSIGFPMLKSAFFEQGHPLAAKERIDIHELENEPFMLLEHGGKTEVTELLEMYGVHLSLR